MPYFKTTDSTRLFYKDYGNGPPVVLVHAWSLSSAMWEYQLPVLLDAGHRCIAMDRRGHGRSDVASTGYDLDTLADDIATLLDPWRRYWPRRSKYRPPASAPWPPPT